MAHKWLAEKDWDDLFWEKNHLPWHKQKIHPLLDENSDLIFELGKTGRILVPLCGKCFEMKWLSDKGYEVVGIEWSSKGVEEFFSENNIPYTKSPSENFEIYKANETNITIYRGDFFDVATKLTGKFDACWDRATVSAMNFEQRSKYAAVMTDLMRTGGRYLFCTMSFGKNTPIERPYPMSESEIELLFGSSFERRTMGSCDVEMNDGSETLYFMKKK